MRSPFTGEEATVANPVVVTRVTIDYVCDGRTFSMVFEDPSTIDAIVLGRRDFNRLRDKQIELADPSLPPEAKVKTHAFNPLVTGEKLAVVADNEFAEPLPPFPIRIRGGAAATESVSFDLNRSLWWHTESCAWVHPEGDQ
jgi:hypothetical protein